MGAVIAASIAAVLSLAAVVLQVKNANTDQTRQLTLRAGRTGASSTPLPSPPSGSIRWSTPRTAETSGPGSRSARWNWSRPTRQCQRL